MFLERLFLFYSETFSVASVKTGGVFQWQNPFMCSLRNLIIKRQASKNGNLKSLNWLLNHPL